MGDSRLGLEVRHGLVVDVGLVPKQQRFDLGGGVQVVQRIFYFQLPVRLAVGSSGGSLACVVMVVVAITGAVRITDVATVVAGGTTTGCWTCVGGTAGAGGRDHTPITWGGRRRAGTATRVGPRGIDSATTYGGNGRTLMKPTGSKVHFIGDKRVRNEHHKSSLWLFFKLYNHERT